MPNAYAIAHLRTPQFNDDVLEYLERIQATLDPFGGRFLVHGADVEVIEGPWPGTIVILEFPGARRGARLVRVTGLPGDPPVAHRSHRR